MGGSVAPGVGALAVQLERILGAVGEAITITAPDGQLVFANPAALERMGGIPLEEALASGPDKLLARFDITTEHGLPLEPDSLPGRRILRGEPAEPILLRLIDRTDGRLMWTLVKATQFVGDDGHRYAVNVLEDVTITKEQERRARFLAEAGEVLSESLDYETTMQRVAALAVPELADWCSVSILEQGEIRQVAVAHIDPRKLEFAREFNRRYPPRLSEEGGVADVLRTGRSKYYPLISEELVAERVADEEQRGMILELQMRSLMIVPMCGPQGVLGAITFVAAESAGAFTPHDLEFMESFASRAATAVENARLYRERSATAATLQRSLLPPRLPRVRGWRIATRYRAADAGGIGGDFYDLFDSEDRFTVVMGDVTGKGVPAATMTALTRHTARAAALLGLSPSEILSLLNRVLLEQEVMTLVTAVVAEFTKGPGEITARVSCAGHPRPIRCRSGSEPVQLGHPGLLLGFDPAGSWVDDSVRLDPVDTVLFFTDGVTDIRGAEDRFGPERLRHLVARAATPPELLLTAIETELASFAVAGRTDDIALLAAQPVPEVD